MELGGQPLTRNRADVAAETINQRLGTSACPVVEVDRLWLTSKTQPNPIGGVIVEHLSGATDWIKRHFDLA
ncbi:hypothetical protein ASD21_05315 [Caulobacter sp. Root1455]|nr:hypothetical protein ASD21_05315 [Caulobacter sp. Root1455]